VSWFPPYGLRLIIALINDEATLKRVYINESNITLVAENPAYKPLVYQGEEMNNVRILGKAVAFQSDVR